ncbi:hypothetical protein KIN20_008144 [Parelaphostrongylus tenuis]|uniref:Uncharacterized protein n=1 Tax=Parelaphostrongylus tenuis TaxID=148309 RepID=A0AAD5MQ16_PARTN|nr:hypothetical protein KIN20_008144 [Parelaphostrongylus tenuis]
MDSRHEMRRRTASPRLWQARCRRFRTAVHPERRYDNVTRRETVAGVFLDDCIKHDGMLG